MEQYCNECGYTLSDNNAACPICTNGNRKPAIIFVSSIAAIVVISLLYSNKYSQQPQTNTLPNNQKESPAAQPAPVQPPSKQKKTWEYMKSQDNMTSKSIHFATIDSTNHHKLGWPHGESSATIIVRTHPTHGTDTIINISAGQTLCYSHTGCTVTARFDDRKAIDFTAQPPSDHSSNSLFIKNKKFINELKASKRLKVGIPLYKDGTPIFEFETDGFEWPPNSQAEKLIQ